MCRRYGAPFQAWGTDEAASLSTLNLYGAACLAAFIGLRFAAVKWGTIATAQRSRGKNTGVRRW